MTTVKLISNAHAGSVSQRTKEVIVKALQADFKLEADATEGRGHATELARDAVDRDFDAVLAFGGDGTINEVAQALVHSKAALGVIPGGSTNVMARSLGIPRDPVEATAFVASRLRSETRRRVNVGRLDERYFIFSAGIGLDAEVVRRIEAHPDSKRKWGEWAFLSNALRAGLTDYRGSPPKLTIEVAGAEPFRAVLAVCCNARPFTYFGRFPVDACPHAQLDKGLDVLGLARLRTVSVPRLVWSLFVSHSHPRWRSALYRHDVGSARITADDPLPVQVDGDYIGERDSGVVSLVPQGLNLIV